jgi:hypothetical protein
MPRISVKLIEERETFTNQNFQAGMSIEQANDALVKKYGMKMNPKRLKELFDANKQDSTHTVIPSGEDASTLPNEIVEFANKESVVFAPSVSPMRPTSKITAEGCLPISELVEQIEQGTYPPVITSSD